MVVWLVFREKKISLAPGIKFRLADRETSLTSPPLSPAFYSYSAAFTGAASSMATRWRSANFNDLFRGQAQPPEIRQSPPELLYSFLVPVVVVGREIRRLGNGGRKDFFLSLREHISLLLFFPCSQRIVSSDSVPPSGWELIKEPSSSSDARVFQGGSRKVSSLKLRTIPSLVSKLLIDLETQRQIRE